MFNNTSRIAGRVAEIEPRSALRGSRGAATVVRRPFSSYGETLTTSLIGYAKQDEAFGEALARLVRQHGLDRGLATHRGGENPGILMPRSREAALRRATWLLGRLRTRYFPAAREAAATLAAWARTHVLAGPKHFVVGVIQVAIPGVTLGKFKKVNETMMVLVRRNRAARRNLELSRAVNRATHGVVLRSLALAGGDATDLEPEVGDWFFGERALAFQAAEESTLQSIEDELAGQGIIHEAVRDGKGIAALAISPAVQDESGRAAWDLIPLET